jgi:predicted alpha/beta-fold hydrolase
MWLRSPHAQTIAGSLSLRRGSAARSFLVESDPGTQILYHADASLRAGASALVIVHGMGGSSQSSMALALARHARLAGLAAVAMNMRNCGGTEGLTPTLYHGNMPQDLEAVVGDLINRHKVGRLVLVGYSVGGNLVLNTLARWGSAAPPEVAAAAVLCPTADVDHCVARLDSPACALYRRHFVSGLRRFYRRKALLFADRFDARRLQGVLSMRDFDRVATAADSGFTDVGEFYRSISSALQIPRIAVPTLLVQALDDPIVQMTQETRARVLGHPSIELVETDLGGHCGFLELPSQGCPDGRWAAHHVARVAAAVLV